MWLFMSLVKAWINYKEPTDFSNGFSYDANVVISEWQQNLERVLWIDKEVDPTQWMTPEDFAKKRDELKIFLNKKILWKQY